jgi:hypothetical protein
MDARGQGAGLGVTPLTVSALGDPAGRLHGSPHSPLSRQWTTDRRTAEGKADVHREFLTPNDEEVHEAVGEWPDSDESGTRILTLRDDSGQSLILSYDALARSVRIRCANDQGIEMLDLFRESATRLSFTSGQSTKHIHIDFRTGECAGTMEIQVTPHLSVHDRLLYQ